MYPAFDWRADDNGGTADIIDILGGVFPARPPDFDQRRAGKRFADVIDGEGDAGLVGDRRQVQRGIE